LNLSSNGRPT